ncbi:MAG: HEAT repeat domain-containing protein [Aggregatilineaceae bacterium]
MIHGLISEEERNARFQRAVALLLDTDAPFTAETIYSLSDLEGEYLERFRTLWPEIPVERRRSLILRLVETAETNFELDFSAIIHPALDDPDDEVRITAMEGVLEDSPRPVIERLMRIARSDASSAVRASAVKTLGQFVLQGELGKLSAALSERLQDLLFDLYLDLSEDLDVRRRALEAIGNCGREGVSELIREAYDADELPMRVSAVFAMGRSCDERWVSQILDELSSEHPEMRYEAARAAGELELRPALARLIELAYEDDREIQEMAIWALGEIGGKQATRALNELAALAEAQEDDELAEAVAEAQASATLSGEDLWPLFDFSDYEEDLLDENGAPLSWRHFHVVGEDEDDFDLADDEEYFDEEDEDGF